jgi:hypothetical protein
LSRFKFGEIQVDVHRAGPDPLSPGLDFYAIKVSREDVFMETQMPFPKSARSSGTDFAIAMNALLYLSPIARHPERWENMMRDEGRISQEEIDATIDVALALQPYLEEAIDKAFERQPMYSEYYEKGVGPLELGIARRLGLPEHIGNKEEIAQFFAYLYLVDHTGVDPDEDFKTFVDRDGRDAYTPAQAELRNALMLEAIQAADAEGLDIYDLALWVGAMTGANDDPEREASTPKWLKELSKEWA